ncbi:hypothetical protein SAMN05421841_3776 [Chryseobacterium wanjuense]|uniref:Uncharacterized protein n=1 Tax=Chryseobacterium wanjuense TaxID=356305 RepID=A0A1I0S1W1_9FLAO|nr:hypothetical protein [Chryseobacterium wanjuense]SEW48282.1 hypothetical protein SAMN05421841_3776 [Chryseobacterium wanjuense]
MSKLFKLTFTLVLFIGTFSFANSKSTDIMIDDLPYLNHISNSPTFKYGCKTFHITVSIKFIEVETDVTVCAGCTSYMAVTCGGSISKNASEQDFTFGGMDLNQLMKDRRFADAEQITVLASSIETDDNTSLTVKRGTYKIIRDENGYGTIVNLEVTK